MMNDKRRTTNNERSTAVFGLLSSAVFSAQPFSPGDLARSILRAGVVAVIEGMRKSTSNEFGQDETIHAAHFQPLTRHIAIAQDFRPTDVGRAADGLGSNDIDQLIGHFAHIDRLILITSRQESDR